VRRTGVLGEALERLAAFGVLAAALGVHSVDRDGVETVLVSVEPDASLQTRRRMAAALAGLRHELIDAEIEVEASDRRGVVYELTGVKDGRTWRIGTQSEVAWIHDNTSAGLAITSAIPPVFDAYATVIIADDDRKRRADELAILRLLADHSRDRAWWLGYLDTGAHDLVFDHAPTVTLYAGWTYVLIEAGAAQAESWRDDDPWRGRLPDLIYPADRSWLVSMLWDDDWRCIGGTTALIQALVAALSPDSRSVTIDEDATPPGHVAR
jgi:hypothetical protein